MTIVPHRAKRPNFDVIYRAVRVLNALAGDARWGGLGRHLCTARAAITALGQVKEYINSLESEIEELEAQKEKEGHGGEPGTANLRTVVEYAHREGRMMDRVLVQTRCNGQWVTHEASEWMQADPAQLAEICHLVNETRESHEPEGEA